MAKRVETCKECLKYEVCHRIDNEIAYNRKGRTLQQIESDLGSVCHMFLNKSNFVEVVRCKDCKYAIELDKHCEINRSAYKHCVLLRGDETKYVWHKYKKYYKDYSIVEPDDFCSCGERKGDNG